MSHADNLERPSGTSLKRMMTCFFFVEGNFDRTLFYIPCSHFKVLEQHEAVVQTKGNIDYKHCIAFIYLSHFKLPLLFKKILFQLFRGIFYLA